MVCLLGLLLDLRNDPTLGAAGQEDLLDRLRDLRLLAIAGQGDESFRRNSANSVSARSTS